MTTKRASTKRSDVTTAAGGFTAAERAAMQERAREVRQAQRGARASRADGEGEVREKIAQMPVPERAMAERIHAIIRQHAPQLSPRTWYGMPAYANARDQTVCFLQSAARFKTRYLTLGFSDQARLDEGEMWPTSFAVHEMTAGVEERIVQLVQRAVHGRASFLAGS